MNRAQPIPPALTDGACAHSPVNATGDRVVVALDDVYEQAAKQFGVDPASISTAAY